MTGTFITISEGNMTTLVGYVSDLLADLSPFLLIIVAVGAGILIFWGIIKAIKP